MHQPVLLDEVLEIFDPQPGQIYIDATVNGGGHARVIAKRVGDGGRVIGIDWDCDLIAELQKKNRDSGIKNMDLICDNYVNIKAIAKRFALPKSDGILLDLGFSSYHIEASGRGFSFQRDEPLDMRYSQEAGRMSAEELVNSTPRDFLEDILRSYGQERFARQIAEGIARARLKQRITTSRELAQIIVRSIPSRYGRGRIHPATRSFQALRIAVNCELENLGRVLAKTLELLQKRGVLAIISFHSLEDALVKNFLKEHTADPGWEVITPKPIRAGDQELRHNPRARSARLRAIRKIV